MIIYAAAVSSKSAEGPRILARTSHRLTDRKLATGETFMRLFSTSSIFPRSIKLFFDESLVFAFCNVLSPLRALSKIWVMDGAGWGQHGSAVEDIILFSRLSQSPELFQKPIGWLCLVFIIRFWIEKARQERRRFFNMMFVCCNWLWGGKLISNWGKWCGWYNRGWYCLLLFA
jgi:hypothetical protein